MKDEKGNSITYWGGLEEPKQELHTCKYCRAETFQPDDECYAKPQQETLEDYVEKLAGDYALNRGISKGVEQRMIDGFVAGYNKAKEENNNYNVIDSDIGTIEVLHDLLLDAHGYELDSIILKRARELTAKMYKSLYNKQVMNKIQTPINKLHSRILFNIGLDDNDIKELDRLVKECINYEKEQLMKTWTKAIDQTQERAWNIVRAYDDFDDYYNETFNK